MFREILASSYARSVAKVKASRSSYAALPGLPDTLDDATLDASGEGHDGSLVVVVYADGH